MFFVGFEYVFNFKKHIIFSLIDFNLIFIFRNLFSYLHLNIFKHLPKTAFNGAWNLMNSFYKYRL